MKRAPLATVTLGAALSLAAGCRRHPSAVVEDAGSPAARAAERAAESHADCRELGGFYWEIGDAKGVLASGSTGAGRTTATTVMPIASASKWMWGAYVVERFKTNLADIDAKAMTMRSGYTVFSTCAGAKTVYDCSIIRDNDKHATIEDGFFYYGGSHYQQYAVKLGLGEKTSAELAAAMSEKLGADLGIGFVGPQLAGSMVMTPAHYGLFLRKMMNGELAIGAHLGENAVCTLPSACKDAHQSPVPEPWRYSYGHWIETDGTFSSPGLYGFYPWIDATKTRYGILARRAMSGLKGEPADSAYWKSVLCGRAIRRAWMEAR